MKNKKKYILLSIVALITIISLVSYRNRDYIRYFITTDKGSRNINSVLSEVYKSLESNYHIFIHNDKLFYSISNVDSANLYKMDLDGNNQELVAENIDLLYGFSFIFNNEVYYYPYDGIKKINLASGKISNAYEEYCKDFPTYDEHSERLCTSLTFIPSTLKKGIITYRATFYNYSEYYYIEFGRIDLTTKEVLDIKEFHIDGDYRWIHYTEFPDYYLDSSSDNIYFIYENYLYENNEVIYELESNINIDLIIIQNEQLYLITNEKIYEIDVKNKKLANTYDNEVKDIKYINVETGLNYFYVYNSDNRAIYTFNNTTKKFEILINNISLIPDNVEINGDYVIINSKQFGHRHNEIGIYNTKNNDLKIYENISSSFINNNILYLIKDKTPTKVQPEDKRYEIIKIDLR